jgi:hypothetical protein
VKSMKGRVARSRAVARWRAAGRELDVTVERLREVTGRAGRAELMGYAALCCQVMVDVAPELPDLMEAARPTLLQVQVGLWRALAEVERGCVPTLSGVAAVRMTDQEWTFWSHLATADGSDRLSMLDALSDLVIGRFPTPTPGASAALEEVADAERHLARIGPRPAYRRSRRRDRRRVLAAGGVR